ncbi:hypothetical protein FRC18_001507 [Serendipita sp. 400]|nr:hypothetical protein FRC18_001507 [Serendipita sp. 400]
MISSLEWILYLSGALVVLGYWRFRKAVNMVSNFPGMRLLVSPMSPPGLLLPALPFPLWTYPGFSFPWELKHAGLFGIFKCDTVSLCAADGRAILFTADVPFITKMSSYASRETFPKPVDEYKVLSYLGSNLVICEGEAWRRQRRIGAPAFSKGMFERLWLDMRDIVREMVEQERWHERTDLHFDEAVTTYRGYTPKRGEILVPHIVDLTLRMALAAIARAGFGMDFTWEAEESFTRVCQGFGNPQRWHWWLVVLHYSWAFLDPLLAPFFHLFDQVTTITPSFVLAPFFYLWQSPVFLPVRIVWVIAFYFLSEIAIVFARPTDADWNPRKIKVHEALHLVAKDSTLRIALPAWTMSLPLRRMRRMKLAFTILEAELKRLADERKAFHLRQTLNNEQLSNGRLPDNRSDLLNNLVRAAMMDEGDLEKGPTGSLVTSSIQKGLTDEEIIGNTYIYFLAGHETTAHSLAWTLALLAAYPEYQDEAVQEINRVWPSTTAAFEPFYENTSFDDYPKFPFVLACYAETLRLFPPVQMIPKVAAQDVSISLETTNQDTTTVAQGADTNLRPSKEVDPFFTSQDSYTSAPHTNFVVKKDTIIMIDPPGVHYNPRYWENPEKFDPGRFMRPYNKDAYIPFGVGHRACLGRKFSEVESVAMLVHVLRNYSVHLMPTSPDGEIDINLSRERFSKASVRITLTPSEVPLIFRRRVHQA